MQFLVNDNFVNLMDDLDIFLGGEAVLKLHIDDFQYEAINIHNEQDTEQEPINTIYMVVPHDAPEDFKSKVTLIGKHAELVISISSSKIVFKNADFSSFDSLFITDRSLINVGSKYAPKYDIPKEDLFDSSLEVEIHNLYVKDFFSSCPKLTIVNSIILSSANIFSNAEKARVLLGNDNDDSIIRNLSIGFLQNTQSEALIKQVKLLGDLNINTSTLKGKNIDSITTNAKWNITCDNLPIWKNICELDQQDIIISPEINIKSNTLTIWNISSNYSKFYIDNYTRISFLQPNNSPSYGFSGIELVINYDGYNDLVIPEGLKHLKFDKIQIFSQANVISYTEINAKIVDLTGPSEIKFKQLIAQEVIVKTRDTGSFVSLENGDIGHFLINGITSVKVIPTSNINIAILEISGSGNVSIWSGTTSTNTKLDLLLIKPPALNSNNTQLVPYSTESQYIINSRNPYFPEVVIRLTSSDSVIVVNQVIAKVNYLRIEEVGNVLGSKIVGNQFFIQPYDIQQKILNISTKNLKLGDIVFGGINIETNNNAVVSIIPDKKLSVGKDNLSNTTIICSRSLSNNLLSNSSSVMANVSVYDASDIFVFGNIDAEKGNFKLKSGKRILMSAEISTSGTVLIDSSYASLCKSYIQSRNLGIASSSGVLIYNSSIDARKFLILSLEELNIHNSNIIADDAAVMTGSAFISDSSLLVSKAAFQALEDFVQVNTNISHIGKTLIPLYDKQIEILEDSSNRIIGLFDPSMQNDLQNMNRQIVESLPSNINDRTIYIVSKNGLIAGSKLTGFEEVIIRSQNDFIILPLILHNRFINLGGVSDNSINKIYSEINAGILDIEAGRAISAIDSVFKAHSGRLSANIISISSLKEHSDANTEMIIKRLNSKRDIIKFLNDIYPISQTLQITDNLAIESDHGPDITSIASAKKLSYTKTSGDIVILSSHHFPQQNIYINVKTGKLIIASPNVQIASCLSGSTNVDSAINAADAARIIVSGNNVYITADIVEISASTLSISENLHIITNKGVFVLPQAIAFRVTNYDGGKTTINESAVAQITSEIYAGILKVTGEELKMVSSFVLAHDIAISVKQLMINAEQNIYNKSVYFKGKKSITGSRKTSDEHTIMASSSYSNMMAENINIEAAEVSIDGGSKVMTSNSLKLYAEKLSLKNAVNLGAHIHHSEKIKSRLKFEVQKGGIFAGGESAYTNNRYSMFSQSNVPSILSSNNELELNVDSIHQKASIISGYKAKIKTKNWISEYQILDDSQKNITRNVRARVGVALQENVSSTVGNVSGVLSSLEDLGHSDYSGINTLLAGYSTFVAVTNLLAGNVISAGFSASATFSISQNKYHRVSFLPSRALFKRLEINEDAKLSGYLELDSEKGTLKSSHLLGINKTPEDEIKTSGYSFSTTISNNGVSSFISREDNGRVIGGSFSHAFGNNGEQGKNSGTILYGNGRNRLDIALPSMLDKETLEKVYGGGWSGIRDKIIDNVNQVAGGLVDGINAATGLDIKHRPVMAKDVKLDFDEFRGRSAVANSSDPDPINDSPKNYVNFAEEGRANSSQQEAHKSGLKQLIEDTDPRVQGGNYINSQYLDYEDTRDSGFTLMGAPYAEASVGAMVGSSTDALIEPVSTAILYGAKKIAQNAARAIPVVGVVSTAGMAIKTVRNIDVATVDALQSKEKQALEIGISLEALHAKDDLFDNLASDDGSFDVRHFNSLRQQHIDDLISQQRNSLPTTIDNSTINSIIVVDDKELKAKDLVTPIPALRGHTILSTPVEERDVKDLVETFPDDSSKFRGYFTLPGFDIHERDFKDLILTFDKSDAEKMVRLRPEFGESVSGADVTKAIDDLYRKTRPYDRSGDFGEPWERKIVGFGQKTGTEGHAEASEELAKHHAKSDDVVAVFINQGINKIAGLTGKINFRPDVVVVKTDGTLELYEIKSKTDEKDDLEERTKQASEKLEEKKWKIGNTEVMDVK